MSVMCKPIPLPVRQFPKVDLPEVPDLVFHLGSTNPDSFEGTILHLVEEIRNETGFGPEDYSRLAKENLATKDGRGFVRCIASWYTWFWKDGDQFMETQSGLNQIVPG